MYNLITNPQYLLPQLPPDGNYCPQGMSTIDLNQKLINLYPNPGKGQFYFSQPLEKKMSYIIYDTIGSKVESNSLAKNESLLNLTHLKNGAYIITFANGLSQRIIITK
jgi:hypothetical protein